MRADEFEPYSSDFDPAEAELADAIRVRRGRLAELIREHEAIEEEIRVLAQARIILQMDSNDSPEAS